MTESRPRYQATGAGKNAYGPDGYDENGLDPWGLSRVDKERIFEKLAKRFEDQPDSMAALLVEYRKQESMSQDSLLAKLEISPAQYSHLALCLVPDIEANFASDLQKLVNASGANIDALADICLQVATIRGLPRRIPEGNSPQEAPQGSRTTILALRMMAARDRDQHAKAMREEGVDYSIEANALAAAPPPQATGAPPNPQPSTEDAQEPSTTEDPHDPKTRRNADDSSSES